MCILSSVKLEKEIFMPNLPKNRMFKLRIQIFTGNKEAAE